MALIGKIREKSWLLVAVVGIAMLAFILGDLDGIFGGGAQEDEYGIGTVDGEKIDENRYQMVLNNVSNQIMQNKMQQNQGQPQPFDENDQRNAESQAWNAAVSEVTLNRELEKVGLIVDQIELENVMFGEDDFTPSPAIASAPVFTDSVTGEFSGNLVRQYIENLENSPNPEAPGELENLYDYIREYRREEKYASLLQRGVHATTVEAEEEYYAQKEVKNITYAYQNFTQVAQDKISEVTEEEIKAYYDENKDLKKFEQDAGRKVAYFAIDVKPSSEDSLTTMNRLAKVKAAFKKEKDDSSFVMRNSETKQFSSDPKAAAVPEGTPGQMNTYPASIADEIENGKPGDVVGPYVNKNFLAVSKIVEYAEVPLATVRHILLSASTDEEKAVAKERADSIMAVIRANNNFEAMVTEFSDDPGSVSKGGKYEDFTEGTMVPAFNDFSFNEPIGKMGAVTTDYGVHIVEVLERKAPKRPILATVNVSVNITKSSMDNANSTASSLIYDLDEMMSGKDLKDRKVLFDSIAKENGYAIRSVNIRDEDPRASGFTQSAEGKILRLAFDEETKEGDLYTAPIRDGERVIVAYLESVRKSGAPSFENIKDRMRTEVRKNKQAEYLMQEMAGREDLKALAQELNAKYETEGITFSSNNVAVGREPIIVGTAFSGLIDGEYSIPVRGNNGVFVLRIDNTVEASETSDFSSEKEQIKSQYRSSIIQQYRSALNESVEVVDNRKLRNFGIR
jgi:peptidyl-prolyl cis-trans isomerase D